jgi:hypothetical protein
MPSKFLRLVSISHREMVFLLTIPDVFSYAIDEFNNPKCGGVKGAGRATATGPWLVTPSHNSNAQYLTADIQTDNLSPNNDQVVFMPDIPQSGNYSIKMYTPGCRGDNTCASRGQVNVTSSTSDAKNSEPKSVVLYQTNEFDKYDEIFNGFVEKTDGFKPSVTLAPVAGQGLITVVAQRVGFEVLNASSDELNGLFEYDPDKQQVEEDFSKSVIDAAGAGLAPEDGATVFALATADNKLFVGGNFTSNDGYNNIFAVENGARTPTQLGGSGLNDQVRTMYAQGDTLFVGGSFTDLMNRGNSDLRGIAAYNNQWQALGAGVNGNVTNIVPFSLNVTDNTPEEVLGISGSFKEVLAFGDNATFAVNGFAVWVPSRKNWLQNLGFQGLSVEGMLTSWADIPNADRLYGGAVSSQAVGASGAAALQYGSDSMSLESFSLNIQDQQQSPTRKRSLTDGQNLTTTGVVTAIFDKQNGANLTVFGGHFALTGSDGQNITNVAIIDGKDSNKITGFSDAVDANSTFAALAVQDNVLFAGGRVTGNINNNAVAGVIAWDLSTKNFASIQPPALQGTNVTVNAIGPRKDSKDVFVGGRFESAGALDCPAMCIWNTERNQWTAPSADITGVVTSLSWISDTRLLVSGHLTVNNNETSIFTYDSSSNQFQTIPGSNELPGTVTAVTPASGDGTQFWAAGQTKDGAAFLQRYDGSKWIPVENQFNPGTEIRGIQALKTEDHDATELMEKDQDLLLLGQINITFPGNRPHTASAVLFNGTTMMPFLLSTTAQNAPGSLSAIFVENPQNFFLNGDKHLALGFIVLIALAIALALTFLLVVAGILVEWYRKRAAGYSPAPTSYTDRMGNVGRVPPDQLFGSLSGPRAPAI